ncbi:MAG TPA: DUF488 domain-containing protein [Thermoanaerobaculia bacterium]|nr:DUF488 domain-containing protein [Thermoanaerobaculia bacterium]
MKHLFSIGHSTRDLSDFISLLKENGVERLADIRRYPGSRRYPHFSREALSLSLPAEGIEYIHMPELGGRRKPLPDSRNTAWRNEQFRAYADHMATDEFRAAIDKLAGSPKRTAYMCAEAVPWRCHRQLVSDELVRRGIEVVHILGKGQTQLHSLNPSAVIEDGHLVYR